MALDLERNHTFSGILNGDFDDALPELQQGYFSYPVEDFFPEYVGALEQQKGAQNNATETGDSGQYDSVQFNGSRPMGMSTAMSLDLPLIPDIPGAQGGLGAGFQGEGLNEATPFAHPGAAVDGLGMPLIGGDYMIEQTPNSESGSGNWAPPDKQTQQPNERSRRGAGGKGRQRADSPGFMEDSDEGEHHAGGGRGGGKTRRNPKQQAQNKQAQQRYRERRKQRFNEMEHAIDELSAKLEQMQSVQAQNSLLQAKRNELEAMLSEKDKEIETLRARVASGAGAEDDADKSPEQRRRLEEAKMKDCQAQAAKHIEELKQYLATHNLENANPTGEGTDAVVVNNLATLVGKGCSTCQSAMRAEGVKVLRLMSSDVKHLSRIKCMRKTSKMMEIVKRLCLTPLQKEQLLVMRTNHLRNLRSVYEARQHLNMQAMGLMLPANERMGSSKENPLDSQMACMSLSGYGKCAQQTVDLDEILNKIKENLRLEQRYVLELNFLTMHRLMSPIQAAIFLTEMHPAFCDALELANALAAFTKNSEGPSTHSSNQDSGELQATHSEEHSGSSADKSDTCSLLQQQEMQSRQQQERQTRQNPEGAAKVA